MAFPNTGTVTGRPETRSVQVATNLTGKEYTFVKLSTLNKVVATADATATPYVLTEGVDGSVTERTVAIVIGGRTKIKLGGTVAIGDRLTATTGGVAIATTTDGDEYGLIAEAAGVSGDIIPATFAEGTISNPA